MRRRCAGCAATCKSSFKIRRRVSNPRMTHRARPSPSPCAYSSRALSARALAAIGWAPCWTRVGLDADMMGRYPHEFSGGQCQRIGDRARHDFESAAPDLRRAGEFPGRVHTGTNRQSAARSAARHGHRDAVHQPQSRRRAAYVPSNSGHVLGQDRGNRAARRTVRRAHPSLYARPAGRRALADAAAEVRAARRRAARGGSGGQSCGADRSGSGGRGGRGAALRGRGLRVS